jgi:ribose-phosphate pyrophosphokinase
MTHILTLRDGRIDNNTKITVYPDGQRTVTLAQLSHKENVEIKCSIKKFEDFELLLALIGALEKNDYFLSKITFVYLTGMRSDRVFAHGQPNYFKSVIAPIINSCKTKIEILEPHNRYIASLVNASEYRPNSWPYLHKLNSTVLGADQSTGELMHFVKMRKDNDLIISPNVNATIALEKYTNEISIVDDLCDGGLTFIRIAEYLKAKYPERPRYLYITHALFSRGIDVVAYHYDHIYCTNSYQDLTHPKLTQIKVI